jgi:hypothetical protein
MQTWWRVRFNIGVGGVFLWALSANAFGQATALPHVYQSGAVAYLSGGVGSSETAAIRQEAPHWPLQLEFAARDASGAAAYLADVKLTVRDVDGKLVLATTTEGPFMLVRLAPGDYRIEATFSGRPMLKSVSIVAGHVVKLTYVWP